MSSNVDALFRWVSFREPNLEIGMNAMAPKAQKNSLRERPTRPRAMSRFSSCERGQSVLELALVTPILLLLLVGIIEIGRFAYYSILVANAARAGAQYGAQNLATAKDTLRIRAAAQNDGLASLTVTPAQLCGCTATDLDACPTTPPRPTCGFGRPLPVYVQVQAKGTFPALFSYPGLPSSITVTSTETMRVAQ